MVTFRICTKLWANKPTQWCDNQRAGRDWLLGYFTLRTPEATFRVRLLVFTDSVNAFLYNLQLVIERDGIIPGKIWNVDKLRCTTVQNCRLVLIKEVLSCQLGTANL